MSSYPSIYLLVSHNYIPVLMHMLYSLKNHQEFIHTKLNYLTFNITSDDLKFLESTGANIKKVTIQKKNQTNKTIAHLSKMCLDIIIEEDEFIFIDTDMWFQDLRCFDVIWKSTLKEGIGATYTKRTKTSKDFHKYSLINKPVKAIPSYILNSGILSIYKQTQLFEKARSYININKQEITPTEEQTCLNYAMHELGVTTSIPWFCNWLVNWNKQEKITLKNGIIYVNDVKPFVIHNLLSTYEIPQKIYINNNVFALILIPELCDNFKYYG